MGSYPRRENAERKARERADTAPALDCQSCGALTTFAGHPLGNVSRQADGREGEVKLHHEPTFQRSFFPTLRPKYSLFHISSGRLRAEPHREHQLAEGCTGNG